MKLMLMNVYLHPSGQMPAYEWNFSDVNPPVHAFATLFLHRTAQALQGETDLEFLRATFHKLLLNFTWWVNRKDRDGNSVFEGGFLGFDNIGVFDRSAPLPTGGYLEQADGTAWMALFSQNMCELAVELAVHEPVYEDMVIKFAEHFYYIAAGMNRPGADGMWDEEDGFYYDRLCLPDGTSLRLKVRSMVGLLPLCATTVGEGGSGRCIPRALNRIGNGCCGYLNFWDNAPHRSGALRCGRAWHHGDGQPGAAAPDSCEDARRERVSGHLTAFVRFPNSTSDHPFIFHVQGQEYRVDYLPAESNTGMFGGNSNWRGPIWMPVNVMIIRALLNFYLYYGDNFKMRMPDRLG